jgi:hypothetical protein
LRACLTGRFDAGEHLNPRTPWFRSCRRVCARGSRPGRCLPQRGARAAGRVSRRRPGLLRSSERSRASACECQTSVTQGSAVESLAQLTP